jgi:hypothetical protein
MLGKPVMRFLLFVIGGVVLNEKDAVAAAIKRRVPDVYNAVADFNICQVNAVKERPVSYAIDVGATRDAGQADADSERIVPDAICPRISNWTL